MSFHFRRVKIGVLLLSMINVMTIVAEIVAPTSSMDAEYLLPSCPLL